MVALLTRMEAGLALTPRSAELASGITLPYVEQGDPAGTPVVFLHGVTDSWHSFEPVLPHLPPSIHAFALTQRGHGDADRPAVGYGMRDFAADLAGFMDAVGLESAVVAGHSMGTTVAQRFAIEHPERTRGLLLAGGSSTFRRNAVVVEYEETVVSSLEDPIDPAVAREFQESTLAHPIPAAFFETVVAESLKVPARVWRAVFAGFVTDPEWAWELATIPASTLLLWGSEDVFCPRRDQEALLAAIPEARLVVYRGAGHALHWEQPERFAADLVAFTECLAG